MRFHQFFQGSRSRAGTLLKAGSLLGLFLAISTGAAAFDGADWQAALPAKLRAAIQEIDWQRYQVVPVPREAGPGLDTARGAGLERLARRHPGRRRVEVDARAGVPLLIEGAGIPWLPGAGNELEATATQRQQPRGGEASVAELATLARNFARDNQALLGADPDLLVLDRRNVAHFGKNNRFWSLRLHAVVRDPALGPIPVRDAYLFFRVGHGNLIQFGNHLAVRPEGIDTAGILSRQQALERALALVGNPGNVLVADPVIDLGQPDRTLQVVPVNLPGGKLGHQLVRSFLLETRDYSVELWLDAHSGELVNVVNRRDEVDGAVRGGIYPVTNTDPEVLRGMPYLEVQNGVPKRTDLGGIYDYAPSGSLASCALDGDYVTINDDCGGSALATSFTPGDLSFGVGAGTDCTTPGYGGAGNTHAARSTYYHVNLIKEKARQYLNGDPQTESPWLDADLTANVNIAMPCNAFWSPGGGTINFYRSADGVGYDCSNTGEIAAVFLHEFGHGLDQNTGGAPPDKGSGEAYGDTMAFLQTHDSCIGNNFKPGFPCQSGCTASCTGVRDVNVSPEATPATIVSGPTDCLGMRTRYDGTTYSLTCPTAGYQGPMGYEGHCESHIASGAVWDMAQAFVGRYGEGAGWALADRIWYESLWDTESAYQVVSGGQCNTAATVDGCGADNWYTVFLALDDDNGNLADGTPNADLIWNAFNSHGIACGAVAPPVNSGCTAPSTPILAAAAATGQVDLSWAAVAGATRYKVFRNEFGCGFGFTPIAEVAAPATAYTDSPVANGTTYYYALQVVGASDLCVSAFSPCQSAAPTAALVPADIFMVLDESGSMAGATDVAGEQKIDALHDAAHMVVDVVDDYAADGFELGAVSFSTAVTGTEALKNLAVPAEKTALENFIDGLAPTDLTAIGQGINAALGAFPGGSSDQKVVMLLSDGIQNVPPMLELAAPPPGAAVGGTALPADVRFYTVALGTAVQEDLFDDLATSGGIPGFYYSGGTADIKANFAFWVAHVLGLDPDPPFPADAADAADTANDQNVVVGGGAGGGGVSSSTTFIVNRTVRRVTFLLTWAAKGTDLRFHLDTPAGPLTPPVSSFHPDRGYAAWTVRLPLLEQPANAHVGNWVLRVTGPQGGPPAVPSVAYALFDDPELRPQYTAGGAAPGAGEPLPLEVTIFENGVPLSGLTVRAMVAGPGEGLGEALSAATVSLPPAGTDPGDAAAQKLALLLAQNPELLGRLSNVITLTEVTPGVYRAELPAARTVAAGTYVMDFSIEGSGIVNGPFHRSERFSRYLRVKPAVANTLVVGELGRLDRETGLQVIRLHITPRDRNNQRLGPGWGSYVRVTPSVGTAGSTVIDNLDGSYTATVEAPAGSDPEVVVEVRGETVASGPVSGWLGGIGGIGGRHLYAGPFLGYTFFDGALPLEDGPVAGGRWSLGVTPRLAFETEIGATFTEDEQKEDGVALQVLQSAVYRFTGFSSGWHPFLAGGVGALICEGFTNDDASLAWIFGAGLEAALGSATILRLDLRDLIADDLYGAGTTHNLQLTAGLTVKLP